VVVARLLGAGETGAYSVILVTLAALTLISTFGLDSAALYYVSAREWRAATAIRQLYVAAALLGVSGALVGVASWFAFRSSAFEGISLATLGLGLVGVPFALSWTFGSYIALALEQYEKAALVPIAQGAVGLALVAIVTPSLGLRGAVAALTLSHVAAALWITVILLRRTGGPAHAWLAHAPSDLRHAARFGLKANAARILSLTNQRADVLILNAYAVQAIVGSYGLALSLTSLQLLLPSSLSSVVVPRVSSLGSGATATERTFVVTKSVRHGIIVSVAAGAGMAVALLAVPLVFGSDFEPAIRLGWILVPGTAAFGLASVLAATIIGGGRPGYIMRSASIVTPLTIGLYFTLIPTFEASGAAVASTVSYSLTLVFYWFYFRRVSGIRGVRRLLPGRDELDDYRALVSQVQTWARGRWLTWPRR
jgi:O-antigen/teichoic acid export membrane protein